MNRLYYAVMALIIFYVGIDVCIPRGYYVYTLFDLITGSYYTYKAIRNVR